MYSEVWFALGTAAALEPIRSRRGDCRLSPGMERTIQNTEACAWKPGSTKVSFSPDPTLLKTKKPPLPATGGWPNGGCARMDIFLLSTNRGSGKAYWLGPGSYSMDRGWAATCG